MHPEYVVELTDRAFDGREWRKITSTVQVEDWQVRGPYLVPVYLNGRVPSDEHPMTEVRLRQIVRAEGRNEPVVV